MVEEAKKREIKRISQKRLKNIALYYLKRFDSSVANLRSVLARRVKDYAYQTPDFDVGQGFSWIEDILKELEGYGYLNDERYAEIKVRGYLTSGKSERYIMIKMREKGIEEELVKKLLGESEYDSYELALRLAKKKKIGPFRDEEKRLDFKQKDMAALVRAGFDYDVVIRVLESDGEENL